MILGFKTEINGKKTFFVQKILSSLWELEKQKTNPKELEIYKSIARYPIKIHTIREDKNNRWKAGVMIDFFTGVRTKAMCRFAPKVPVVSRQNIEIIYDKIFGKNLYPSIFIDGIRLHPKKIEDLAKNDGFDSIEDFLNFFNKDFTGKIIHWTAFKY